VWRHMEDEDRVSDVMLTALCSVLDIYVVCRARAWLQAIFKETVASVVMISAMQILSFIYPVLYVYEDTLKRGILACSFDANGCISCCYSMLAEKLNMAPEEAERWIVNLIRNAHLDAKIDSKLVCL